MGADTAGWSPEHRMPWERVEAHPFENDGVALDVTRRLARTLGWPLDDIRALVEECTAASASLPSSAISAR